jgi:uncharacterized membrane protein YfhO
MNPISNILWQLIPNVGSMLTLYSRLSLALSFSISIIAGYFVLNYIKKEKLIYLLIILTIASTTLNWGHRKTITQITDEDLKQGVPLSTSKEGPSYFADTKWADPNNLWFSKIPEKHIEILEGKGTITQVKRSSTLHIYKINAKTNLTIKENTLYFPGWNLQSNNKQINIYPGNKGIIEFKLQKGEQIIELKYEDISIIYLFKLVFIIGITMLFLTLLFVFLLGI